MEHILKSLKSVMFVYYSFVFFEITLESKEYVLGFLIYVRIFQKVRASIEIQFNFHMLQFVSKVAVYIYKVQLS